MPDPAKLDALASAGFVVRRVCANCEHFRESQDLRAPGWGTCGLIAHVHRKHGTRERTGVLAVGSCPSHAFLVGEGVALVRSGYERFLEPKP